jgi:diguanylate cyclase (GGDEF)-like protein/PAS domain S-box-containing protein
MLETDSISNLHLDLEKTFGAMDECVVIARPDRRVLFVNRATELLFGYSRDELIGHTSAHLYVNQNDFKVAGTHNSSAVRANNSRKYAVSLKRKNGSIFTCEVVTTPLYDASAQHAGYIFIGRDISDRIALEQMAEDAASNLEDAIESISEGFALYDQDDRLVICNENYKRIYPESAEAMRPGACFSDILKYGLKNGQYDTGALSDEQWLDIRLARHQKADGAIVEQKLANGRWLQIAERRTRSNGIAGIRTDITELKKAQEELRDAYSNITILTDSLSCSITEIDLEGTCLFINDYGARWLGATPAELIGTKVRERYSKGLLQRSKAKFDRAVAGERVTHESQETYPDGVRRWVVVEYIPKLNEAGQTSGLIIFVTDVTDNKKVEATLSSLYGVTSTRDLGYDEKIQQILRIGCEHYDLPFGIISQIVENSYSVKWAECPNKEIEAGATFSLGDTYCANTLTAASPVAIAHTAESELAVHPCYKIFGLETYIGAPLLVDGVRYGTINFTSPDPRRRPFTKTDTEIIRQFADWIGNEIARELDHQALMNAKVRLERLASTDDLTGILNRRAFMERANTEVARYRRSGRHFSAIMLDIDHFKSINDTYGHAAGDEILKLFSSNVGSSLRAIDVFGRVGGEEFCILLSDTEPEDALTVAERIRENVQANCRLPNMTQEVTCSLGVACISPDDIEFASLMQRADNALYQAKRTGRNRCVYVGPSSTPSKKKAVAAER